MLGLILNAIVTLARDRGHLFLLCLLLGSYLKWDTHWRLWNAKQYPGIAKISSFRAKGKRFLRFPEKCNVWKICNSSSASVMISEIRIHPGDSTQAEMNLWAIFYLFLHTLIGVEAGLCLQQDCIALVQPKQWEKNLGRGKKVVITIGLPPPLQPCTNHNKQNIYPMVFYNAINSWPSLIKA